MNFVWTFETNIEDSFVRPGDEKKILTAIRRGMAFCSCFWRNSKVDISVLDCSTCSYKSSTCLINPCALDWNQWVNTSIHLKLGHDYYLIASGEDFELLLDFCCSLGFLGHVLPVVLQLSLQRLQSVFLTGQVGSGVPVLGGQVQHLGQALVPHLGVGVERQVTVAHALLHHVQLFFQQLLSLKNNISLLKNTSLNTLVTKKNKHTQHYFF